MKTLRELAKYLRKVMRPLRRFIPVSFIIFSMTVQAFAQPPAPNALPTGAQVASGQASVSQTGSSMNIQQATGKVIVNWNTFDIGAVAAVRFNQPTPSSVALNRVRSSNPSYIYGQLTANGKIVLINPGGILFGPGCYVNVGSFVASTMDMADNDFLSGNYRFTRDGSTGTIVNQGIIRTADGRGYIAMLAPEVRNEGVIAAKMGTIALAAGDAVTLNMEGDTLLGVRVDPATVTTLLENKHIIEADGGTIIMSTSAAGQLLESAISNDGALIASSLVDRGGVISLVGADNIANTGTLDASGKTGGGLVQVSANNIADVGGTIDVSATQSGNGGNIRVWSDRETYFSGNASARGAGNGNGGFIETSGQALQFSGMADASSPGGQAGTLLLDPKYITVATNGTYTGGYLYSDNPSLSVTITPSTLTDVLNTGTNLTLQANSDITVSNDIIATPPIGNGGDLALSAGRSVFLNANITTANGKLTVTSNDTNANGVLAAYRDPGTASISMASTQTIDAGAGAVSMTILSGGNGAAGDITVSNINADSITVQTPGNININSGSTLTASNSGNAIALEAGGNFVNNAGSSALSATTGRWLIYSANPNNNTFGALASGNNAVWNKTYSNYPPGSVIETGNLYLFSFQPTVTFAPSDANKIYGDPAGIDSSYTVSGVQTGTYGGAIVADTDAIAYSGVPTVSSTGSPLTANAGTYNITLGNGSISALDGYKFSVNNSTPGTLTVNTRPLTITANDDSRIYGDPNPSVTAFTAATGSAGSGSDLVNGDSVSSVTGTHTTTLTSNVGTYASSITPSAAVFGSGLASNYAITYVSGSMTINTRPLTITANDASRIYGDPNPSVTAFTAATGSAGSGSDLVNGDTVRSVTNTVNASLTTNAGTASITPSAAVFGSGLASNYAITYADGSLTINTRPLTITASDASRIYGDPNPSVTAFTAPTGSAGSGSGLVNGDSVSSVTGTHDTTLTSDAGTYASSITPSAAVFGSGLDSNYEITYASGSMTINTRPLTITASNASRIYGDPNPSVTAFTAPTGSAGSGSGLVNGDSVSSVTGAHTTTLTSNAGTYASSITPSAAVFGSGLDSDYAITYANGSMTINTRPLTITAANGSKIYGNSNPSVTGFTAPTGSAGSGSGLVNGDSVASVTGAYTTTLTSNAGTYASSITPSSAVFGAGLAGNYAITYSNGTLTINTRPLTITAGNSSRVYGVRNPAVTSFTATTGSSGSGSGLVNSDSVSSVTNTVNALLTTNAGSASITPSAAVFGSGLASNYAITYSNGTLTINTRPLTITAANGSKIYGDPNPSVTGFTAPTGSAGSGSGLVNGDSVKSVTNTVNASLTTNAGSASITPSAAVFGSGLAGNYAITYSNGTLTIVPLPNINVGIVKVSISTAVVSPNITFSATSTPVNNSLAISSGGAIGIEAGTVTETGTGTETDVGTTNSSKSCESGSGKC